MQTLQILNLNEPSEVREFPHGRFEVYVVDGRELGRATYEPGWRWSTHVAAQVGTELCEVEHLGLVLSGAAAVRMSDGQERIMREGDFFAIPAGHDSWVVGDVPYVSLHLLDAGAYAKPR